MSQPWWANVLGRGKTRAIANAFRSHGGLTPAALGRVHFPVKVAVSPLSRFANHGGLTPAALGNVRLCTANVVIFQPTGTVQQEPLM